MSASTIIPANNAISLVTAGRAGWTERCSQLFDLFSMHHLVKMFDLLTGDYTVF
jgi:hypothetical protein